MSYLRTEIAELWAGRDPLERAFALTGEVFRDVPGRRTLRVELAGRHYFLKLHYGIGWREVIKNWLQFKRPVIGAANEFTACRDLDTLGIRAPVPAAYAASADSIARQRSFVLCDELAGYISLEDLTDDWALNPPTPHLRYRIMYAVADFARRFHEAGFVHRDFYICHILINAAQLERDEIELAVLDLHRAQRFDRLPRRWRKRDMAALLFSSLDLGFTQRDWLRFLRRYRSLPLRVVLQQEGAFWRQVLNRAQRLYREGQRKGIVKGLYTP